MKKKSTTERLDSITDYLNTQNHRLNKLNDKYGLECEYDDMDNEPHRELTADENQEIYHVILSLEGIARELRELKKEQPDDKQQAA